MGRHVKLHGQGKILTGLFWLQGEAKRMNDILEIF
jgi:hypothetical protein